MEIIMNSNPTQASDSLLTFPCVFPIKVMGRTQDGFAQAVVAVVQKHAADFEPSTLEMRSSKAGNYLSLTCTVNATSRDQLDNLYRDLTSHPMVSMVF
jgi:putative lipoic acid-binding regulatory protein